MLFRAVPVRATQYVVRSGDASVYVIRNGSDEATNATALSGVRHK
jgi:hypothetical protein